MRARALARIIQLIIHVTNRQKALKISRNQVRQIVQQVLGHEGTNADEVNIYFVGIPTISRLHLEFFDDPSPTDCMTFPIDDADASPRLLGEIFICPAVALEYGLRNKKDPFEEVTLYLVHGLLHLLGYDDIRAEDRQAMRQAESRHMRKLKKRCLQLTA